MRNLTQQALSIGRTGEKWVYVYMPACESVCVRACAREYVHLCNALCGPKTKRIPTTSLQSPTLRLQTLSKVHVYCPEPGHWGSGDGGGKAGPVPSPWDLLKTLPELKKNPIVTAASPTRQPNPECRAELEKEVADLSTDHSHL